MKIAEREAEPMKKFCRFVCMFMAAMFCFTGCGTETQTETRDAGGATQEVNTIKTPQPQEESDTTETMETGQEVASLVTGEPDASEIAEAVKQLKAGINQFSYRIFEQLENGENMVISPYSMAIAISMLDNGADGQTKSEIEKMLGIEDLGEWNSCVKYYMSLNKEEQAKLLTANSLWLSEDLVLSENAVTDFFNPVENYYEAEKYQMNLSSEEALDQINSWVFDKTDHMIDKILTEKLNSEVEMLLINAVYFKGEWKEKFEEENTVKEKFYGKDKTSKTDMMSQYNTSYRYIVKHGIKAIELPYGNDNIVMDILLPEEEEKEINQLFSSLSDKEKSGIFTKLSEAESENLEIVKIPKFNMEYGVKEIASDLKALGMKQAFDCENADFSKISPQMYAGSVLHKAKIEVDEEGTKAAAVTEIEMKVNSVKLDVGETFIANQPFIFVIRDSANDMILFIGSVQNLGE